jgi:hypothetical protein
VRGYIMGPGLCGSEVWPRRRKGAARLSCPSISLLSRCETERSERSVPRESSRTIVEYSAAAGPAAPLGGFRTQG